MKWTDVSSGNLTAANQRLWESFGDDAGMISTTLRSRPAFATRIADFAREELKIETSFNLAREIMGKNFFGPKEAVKHFGVSYETEHKKVLSVVPFSASVLRECKDSHILAAVFPLSIVDIGLLKDQQGRSIEIFGCSDWYQHRDWGCATGTLSWQLVRKTPVPESFGKSYREQERLLSKAALEEVPTMQILVYVIVGYFLATRNWLFDQVEVRGSDRDITVASNLHLPSYKVYLSSNWHEGCKPGIGLASVVKPYSF